jgi:hypothetical protein
MFLALKWLTNLNVFLKPYGIDAADVSADALARVQDLSPPRCGVEPRLRLP